MRTVYIVVTDPGRPYLLTVAGRIPAVELLDCAFLPSRVPEVCVRCRAGFQLEIVVLRHLATSEDAEVVEAEMLRAPPARSEHEWRATSWLERHDEPILRRAAVALCGSTSPERSALERHGWYQRAVSWVSSVLASRDERPRKVTQLKGAWGWSSLLGVETEASTQYILKANSPRDSFEGDVLELLETRCGGRVPTVIAKDARNQWFLMAHFGGELLSGDLGSATLRGLPSAQELAVVQRYAALQRATEPFIDDFRDLGCPCIDGQNLVLAGRRLLAAGLSNGPWALTADELERLERVWPTVDELASRLDRTKTARTLSSRDFRGGNIALTPSGPTYFDWAEAAVAHPFFSMAYYLQRRGRPDGISRWVIAGLDIPEVKRLWDRYLVEWDASGALDVRCIVALLPLYEAVRLEESLRFMDPSMPWGRSTLDYIPECFRGLLLALEG